MSHSFFDSLKSFGVSAMYRFSFISLLCASVLLLPSCSFMGIATGAGTAVGVAATQEGGISRAADDARIQLQINDLWFKYNVDMFTKLDLTINQGRVLITGVVQDPEHRVEAVRLAWQPKGVKQVINEITVAKSEGILGFAKDTWISTRLRTALTFDKEIQSINYNIDTVQGTVYLMGFAQSRLELNKVTELARTINGVKNVVSYVKIVGQDDGLAPVNTSDIQAMEAQSYETMPTYSEPQQGYDTGYGVGDAPNNSVSTGPYDASAYDAVPGNNSSSDYSASPGAPIDLAPQDYNTPYNNQGYNQTPAIEVERLP